MLSYTVAHLPQYAWAFVVAGVNTLISAYFYSTKRSVHAIALNVARSLVVNTAVITLLPLLFGGAIVWFTFDISECVVLLLAAILLCVSERDGIVYR